MTHKESESLSFDFYPLTPERWSDLEKLFGKNGACGGCWCMWWRIPRAQFSRQKGKENRNALRSIVNSGEIPGLLAYSENQPIGWCAVAPRKRYQSLEHSRILRKVDDAPVWSVVCFFVAKAFRHKGVTVKLLEAAIKHVEENGGKVIEGYPTEPRKSRTPDTFAYMGLASAFRKAGFVEVIRRSETRPIMRYSVGEV